MRWNRIKTVDVIPEKKSNSYLSAVIVRFRQHKLAMVSMILLAIIFIAAIFAPVLTSYDPNEITGAFRASPDRLHILGTDQVGRDVFSRVLHGTRISLLVGFSSVAISLGIGVVLGLISGYFGGVADMLIMRITDVFMSFPYMMLILVVAGIIGPGLMNIILILGFLNWPAVTRLVRGNVLSIKEQDYVKAAFIQGYGTGRILFSEILPNTIAPIIIYASSGVAWAILDEAALSFLGFGVQPPTASLGNMLNGTQSLTLLTTSPWLWIPPGIVIILIVLSINFIGDALRDAFDPQNMK